MSTGVARSLGSSLRSASLVSSVGGCSSRWCTLRSLLMQSAIFPATVTASVHIDLSSMSAGGGVHVPCVYSSTSGVFVAISILHRTHVGELRPSTLNVLPDSFETDGQNRCSCSSSPPELWQPCVGCSTRHESSSSEEERDSFESSSIIDKFDWLVDSSAG